MRRRPHIVAIVLGALLLHGCAAEDVDSARERVADVRADAERRLEEARDEFERRRERYGRRIREVLGDLERVFERPDRTSAVVRVRGRNGPTTIDAYLTDVLENVDAYWTRTFRAAGLPPPRVAYEWVAPGDRINLTGCGISAGETEAFYCPGDDTIYIGQRFAAGVYKGVVSGFPGESAGHGRAAGDFAVAYIVAHEYAHNLQQELGIFDNRRSSGAKPYELQADCMAGVWAYSVFEAGALGPGDLEEATNAALAVGDFEVGAEQHHGRPEERRDALLTGYESGEPGACTHFLPA